MIYCQKEVDRASGNQEGCKICVTLHESLTRQNRINLPCIFPFSKVLPHTFFPYHAFPVLKISTFSHFTDHDNIVLRDNL